MANHDDNVGRSHRAITKYMDTTPWAMEPSRLEVLHQVVADHMAGMNVELQADAKSSSVATNSLGNIAIIPVHGTIMKRAYGLQAISGARTTLDIKQDIEQALQNPAISGIVLDIDSPGGTVDGTKELADYIKKATTSKTIVGYANGMMCSAAMWLGSACSHIVGFPTSTIGSIGVIIQHQDWSKAEEDAGLKTTFVYAGKYKAMGNSSEPLSPESKEYIQSKIDGIYSMFVDDIATNRELSTSYVLNNLATAATWLAQEAMELKLIDSVGNMEDAIAIAQDGGTKQMAEENVETTVEMSPEVKEMFDAMQASLDASAAQINTLVEAKEAADKALADNLAAQAAAEKAAAIDELFAGCTVSEDFMAIAHGMELDAASVLAAEMQSKEKQVEDTLEGHLEPAGNNELKKQEASTVTSVDEAVTFIMKRDGIDADSACDKAVAEYPELFVS